MKLRNIDEYKNLSGGRAIELAASQADTDLKAYDFPLPLARQRDCQFSFAGLKNSAYRRISHDELEFDIAVDQVIPDYKNFCAAFQKALIRHLCHRTQRAIEYTELEQLFSNDDRRILVVSGGVACNDLLFNTVSQVGKIFNYDVIRPTKHLCTDNGVMIAWNGVERFKENLDVIHENDFDTINAYGRHPLGENWTNKVIDKNIKCDWVKIT